MPKSFHLPAASSGTVQIDEKTVEVYVFPASSSQRRLWFLDQLKPGTSSYNLPIALRIEGDINTVALELALREIVSRHESLRTTFDLLENDLVQIISPQTIFDLERVALDNEPEADRERIAEQLVGEEVKRPFDLRKGPLFRGTLYTINPRTHLLVLNMHHCVADGWSFAVILRELETLYEDFCEGNDPSLNDLPIQYADYAQWQQEYQSGEDFKSQLKFWRGHLEGAPGHLNLPMDRPRPDVPSFAGATESILLSEKLVQSVKRLSRGEGTTPFMTMLAAFKSLLYRYTGQSDIVVGSPIANRNSVEVEDLIGCFVNTLLFRTQFSGQMSFREILSRVREVSLETFNHQDIPFEKLVEELQPERELNRNPFFDTMFIYQQAFIQPVRLSGITLTPFRVDRKGAQIDMTFFLLEREEGVRVACEYATDLFDATTISRFLGHFKTLLESAVANPDQKISKLHLLTDEERRKMLVEWNDTRKEYPADLCLHELIELQVERTPEAMAVKSENRTLSYRELNAKANQLANRLKKIGVGPDVLVGVCLERSLEMITALLAILKAGGAYVPLDPAYPQARLAFMLEDAAVAALLTQQTLLQILPQHSAEVICLDSDWEEITKESDQNIEGRVKAENLAYVIYTSGSTGKPKGVMIPHLGLVNYLHWCTDAYDVQKWRGAPVHSPLGFDLTVTSLLSPLLVGRTTFLLPEKPGVESLAAALESEDNFSLVKITPAHLEVLSQLLRGRDVEGRAKALIIGGEALLKEHLSFWHTYAPHTRIINEYGPTETVVGCCVYEVSDFETVSNAIPIGRPIANTQLYILDDQLQPVPIGVTGQLHIAGAGLARGYLNQADLTAEKFIRNPFSDVADARMYQTGDLARYRPDGNIELLGRIDDQVKVRGYRIELGEIEAALEQHPSVREALVAVRGEAGEKVLVAYVTPAGELASLEELKSYLEGQLPGYMVPAAIVEMESFPLTQNGKVDRLSLPAPDMSPASRKEGFVAPRDDMELQLAGIWQDMFHIESISVKDNFFELGGHSLMAVKMFSRIREAIGKDLALATLFDASTIEQLANVLREEDSEEWSSLVPINSKGSKIPFFCIHAGGGNVLFYRDLAKHLGPTRPFYGIQPKGLDGKQERQVRIEEMADYYIQEIKKVQPQGPYCLGGSSFGGLVAYEMAIQLEDRGDSVGLVALFDTYAPGYLKPLPGRSRLRVRFSLLVQRFEHHVDTLVMLEAGARWPYIVAKATKAKNQFRRTIKNTRKRLARGLLKRLGRPLPEALRETQNAIRVASRSYQPRPYSGPVTLFRATKQPLNIYPDPTLGWGELVPGSMEIHEVPGSHGTIVVEPRVRFLIGKLEQCLERAEAPEPELAVSA